MRGDADPQPHLFSSSSAEERVPAKHPLRSIKAHTDSALKQIRPALDSSPCTRFAVIDLFCETLDYNILFRWVSDMGLEEPSFGAATFGKNQERLAGEKVALRFFYAVAAKRLRLRCSSSYSAKSASAR